MALSVLSPYSGEKIGEVDTASEKQIDQALGRAYALFRARDGWLPVHERVAILERTAQLMTGQREQLALQAASEGGKPLNDSLVETDRAIDGVRLCIEAIRDDAGTVIPMQGTAAGAGRIAFTQKEPIGVVVAVSAFNHPLNLIIHQVAAAVASGCPVIVKPADDTPLSGRSFVQLLHQAGLPPAWCQFVMPDGLELAEKMVTDERVGFFSFIGSARVGWMLRSKLAPGTRCALEHGGAAAVILAEDADLDIAVAAIAKGGFYHAGQVCVSVQRVFAPKSIATDFVRRLTDAARKQRIGDPTSADTDVGPLIRPREVERVARWVEASGAAGGGAPLDNNCYPCTVLHNPDPASDISTQEIFGPVVAVYDYEKLDTALERANELPFAFQAALFTQDIDRALYIYRHLDASAIMVNNHSAFRVDGMPFAGLRRSGLGTGGIPYTIEDMQINKMIVLNPKKL